MAEIDLDDFDFEATPQKTKGKGRVPLTDEERQKAKTIKKNEQLIQQKIARYKSDFELDSLTTVDMQQIRNMAALEVLNERITNKIALLGDDLSPTEYKQLIESARTAMGEYRQQAQALGINRAKRVSDEESEMDVYLPKLAKEAKDFLYARAISIMCQECRKEPGEIDIRLGTIIYHFDTTDKKFSWESTCPRCGKRVHIHNRNWQQFRMSELDKRNQQIDELGEDDVTDEEIAAESVEIENDPTEVESPSEPTSD